MLTSHASKESLGESAGVVVQHEAKIEATNHLCESFSEAAGVADALEIHSKCGQWFQFPASQATTKENIVRICFQAVASQNPLQHGMDLVVAGLAQCQLFHCHRPMLV